MTGITQIPMYRYASRRHGRLVYTYTTVRRRKKDRPVCYYDMDKRRYVNWREEQ